MGEGSRHLEVPCDESGRHLGVPCGEAVRRGRHLEPPCAGASSRGRHEGGRWSANERRGVCGWGESAPAEDQRAMWMILASAVGGAAGGWLGYMEMTIDGSR